MATTALTQGIAGRVVQERVGHSEIATTIAIYRHVMPEVHEQAPDELEAAIFDGNRDGNASEQRRIVANTDSSM